MRVTLRVRPGASRTAVGGSYDGALVVAVNARAVDGQATTAVLKALAKALGIAPRDVRLVHGATSRTKVVDIPDSCANDVARLLTPPSAPDP